MGFLSKIFSKEKKYNIPEGFTVTAHSGSNDTKDNTIPSLKVALVSGADIVEFDLNVSDNGELVISHDAPKGEPVPTFEEALLLVKEHEGTRINIDVKTTERIDKAQEIILKADMLDRVFYTGIDECFVTAVKEKSPQVAYYLNCHPNQIDMLKESECEKLADHAIELGCIGLNINYHFVSPQLVEMCHKKNLLISVWTVNQKSDMEKYLAMGVDNITTRKPTVLKNLISK